VSSACVLNLIHTSIHLILNKHAINKMCCPYTQRSVRVHIVTNIALSLICVRFFNNKQWYTRQSAQAKSCTRVTFV